MEPNTARIYTDASFCHNSKVGGAAGLIVTRDGIRSVSHHFRDVDIYKLEILAVQLAVFSLPKKMETLEIFTDSQQIVKVLMRKDGPVFTRHKSHSSIKERIAAAYLMEDLYHLIREKSKWWMIKWVKAHNGHPFNNVADWLAGETRKEAEYVRSTCNQALLESKSPVLTAAG